MRIANSFILAAISAAFFMGSSLAQNAGSVTNHAFAIGKGPGSTGYTSLLCGSAQLAVGQSAADPICKTITGDVTITSAGVTTIGAGVVSLGKLASGTQDTIIGYFGSTAASALAINNCAGALTYSTSSHAFGCNSTSSSSIQPPGGRLTISSGVPVLVSAQLNQTTLYYAPYATNVVPIYNGTSTQMYQFTSSTTDAVGLSLALGSNWAANTVYDAFVGLNGGNPVLCTGPAWTSGTARAATGGLSIFGGMQTNASNGMTCRINNTTTISCSTNQCTHVGTVLTDASNSGQISWTPGSSAAGGGAARLSIWNVANREMVRAQVINSTANWTTTSAAPRQINGSTTMNVTFVSGASVDGIDAKYIAGFTLPATAGAYYEPGLSLDASNTQDHYNFQSTPVATALTSICTVVATYAPQLGTHFVAAVEAADGTHGVTVAGGIGGTGAPNSVLEFSMLM